MRKLLNKEKEGRKDKVLCLSCATAEDTVIISEAKHFCEDCKFNICVPCKNIHGRLPLTRSHKIVSLGKLSEASLIKHQDQLS